MYNWPQMFNQSLKTKLLTNSYFLNFYLSVLLLLLTSYILSRDT